MDLLRQLVQIESTTGKELDCALFLKSFLEKHGFAVELQQVEPQRPNVFAYHPQDPYKGHLKLPHC
jgi:acetylornithine deacetylase/succinyl-diaminopimelate desuccinylase-like protein